MSIQLQELFLTLPGGAGSLLDRLREAIPRALPPGAWPVRLAVTSSSASSLEVELGLADAGPAGSDPFEFRRRPGHKADSFQAVFVVPTGIGADLGALVLPDGCLGLPTLAALEQGIPVVAVHDPGQRMANDLSALPWAPGQFLRVSNYLEAAGALLALRAGVSTESVRRPLAPTAFSRSPISGA